MPSSRLSLSCKDLPKRQGDTTANNATIVLSREWLSKQINKLSICKQWLETVVDDPTSPCWIWTWHAWKTHSNIFILAVFTEPDCFSKVQVRLGTEVPVSSAGKITMLEEAALHHASSLDWCGMASFFPTQLAESHLAFELGNPCCCIEMVVCWAQSGCASKDGSYSFGTVLNLNAKTCPSYKRTWIFVLCSSCSSCLSGEGL